MDFKSQMLILRLPGGQRGCVTLMHVSVGMFSWVPVFCCAKKITMSHPASPKSSFPPLKKLFRSKGRFQVARNFISVWRTPELFCSGPSRALNEESVLYNDPLGLFVLSVGFLETQVTFGHRSHIYS